MNQEIKKTNTEEQQLQDQKYMRLALELAKKGCGHVNPNPMVGAVIVKDGRIIGQGYHEKYGELHAERNALASLTESAEGATIYVTLEPCSHYGKQPPCCVALAEHKLARVVIGSRDPNPLVSGRGVKYLREHGTQVVEDVLRDECDAINEVFFYYIQNQLPYVVMKYAMTMDGKIAAYTGKSQWITGEEARRNVHRDRNRYAAIMTGVGTVLKDDPMLNCRIEGGRNPVRIICDSSLRTPLYSRIVQTAREIPTWIATCCEDKEKQKLYKDAGCEVLVIRPEDGRVDLQFLAMELGARKIDSVYLEGGATLNWSALNSSIVKKVHTYIAPKLLGGSTAPTPVGGTGAEDPQHGWKLTNTKLTQLGDDILLESDVEYEGRTACLQES